jgi:Uncharacterised nucleotidyltransferase
MKWRQPADRRVVEAVITTFCGSAETSMQRLSVLRERDWVRSYYWLDASGLALYFVAELESLGIEDVLPAEVLGRLRENLADNRVRVGSMFAEFVSLNQAFRDAGVDFANLKGFTVSPESCPDPALRRALDFDFLVDGCHLNICKEILEDRGYTLAARTGRNWEFKAGSTEIGGMEDFYKANRRRAVELHFASLPGSPPDGPTPTRDARLDRLALRSWGGVDFPALSPSEQFVGQALHVFGHLCGSSTRPSWVLEYGNHVAHYFNDQDFWESVKEWSRTHRDAPIAIGMASLLLSQLFGRETPRQLDEWTIDCLPPSVRLWAEQYGRRVVLGDLPGMKLYLLLLQELRSGDEARQMERQNRRLLLPAPRVPRIIDTAPGDSLRVRLGKEIHQARFVLFRLRFHIVEGVRYLIEAARWRRQLRALRSVAEAKPALAIGNPSEAKDWNS